MQVKEVMTRNAECTRPQATLREVAQRMKELNVGAMPVCGEDRLVGMITDRDITIRSVADGESAAASHVSDVMTPRVIYCLDDQDVTEAAAVMEREQIRRLPVIDHNNQRLVGILSLGDLAVRTADERMAGHTLGYISEPSIPHH